MKPGLFWPGFLKTMIQDTTLSCLYLCFKLLDQKMFLLVDRGEKYF